MFPMFETKVDSDEVPLAVCDRDLEAETAPAEAPTDKDTDEDSSSVDD